MKFLSRTCGCNKEGSKTHSSTDFDTSSEQANSPEVRERARLNVGGVIHEIQWKHLRDRAPNSRLALIERSRRPGELLQQNLIDDFDEGKREYFFDRHSEAFINILNFFRTGKLHIPTNICPIAFRDELKYWKLRDYLTESCCHGRHLERKDEARKVVKKEKEMQEQMVRGEFAGQHCAAFRKKLWDVTEKPSCSNIPALIFAFFSVMMVVFSTVALMLDTVPKRQGKAEVTTDRWQGNATTMPTPYLDGTVDRETFNVTEVSVKNSSNTNETARKIAIFNMTEDNGDGNPALHIIEIGCISYFAFEFILRLVISPKKWEFLNSPLSIIDILAVFTGLGMIVLKAHYSLFEHAALAFQIFRMSRIMRILKIARHFTGLQSLGYTLRQSCSELLLLMLSLVMGITFFSSFAYLAEKDVHMTKFTSIPESLWWATITMTTVGYGDMYPETKLGKFVASVCCIVGVLAIALPVPIIVDKFSKFYKNQKRQEKSIKRKMKKEMGNTKANDGDDKAKANDGDDNDNGDLTEIVIAEEQSARAGEVENPVTFPVSRIDELDDSHYSTPTRQSGTPTEIGLNLPTENSRAQNYDDLEVSRRLDARENSNANQNDDCIVDFGNEFLEKSVSLTVNDKNGRQYATFVRDGPSNSTPSRPSTRPECSNAGGQEATFVQPAFSVATNFIMNPLSLLQSYEPVPTAEPALRNITDDSRTGAETSDSTVAEEVFEGHGVRTRSLSR